MTFLNRHRSRIRPVGPFAPSSLFFGGIPGAWYDPTDLSTMFQDSAGTTPVTAVEQPVGLILDKSGNGNHASQSTAASRPTYRARYNLLTFSEQLDNAAGWSAARGVATGDTTVAPDGTTTADTWTEDNQVGDHDLRQVIAITNGVTYTISCYFKANTRTFAQISTFGTGIGLRGAVVNLSNGSVANMGGGYGAFASVSATALANGWYRLQVTQTAGATGNTTLSVGATTTSTGTPSYAGDGVSSLYIWGAQLLTAADVTATGNAYQRIAAATVYDTAPIFRPYLAFDGLDDSLSTAAIDFTSTDKMTVFAGVTKLSTVVGMITELSAAANLNAGAFYIDGGENAAGDFTFRLSGSPLTVGGGSTAGASVPVTQVLTSSLNQAGATLATQNAVRINAASAAYVSSAGLSGGGNFGNWPLFIGRRNNASTALNGRIYELIVRGAASSVTEIADTELWVNARTGGF